MGNAVCGHFLIQVLLGNAVCGHGLIQVLLGNAVFGMLDNPIHVYNGHGSTQGLLNNAVCRHGVTHETPITHVLLDNAVYNKLDQLITKLILL